MNRAKRRQQTQLERAQAELEQRRLLTEQERPIHRPQNEAERRSLVEHRIQEAMKDGAFDNLPGQGKPLRFNQNPYLEPGQELAFGLLKNNGFAPEWIERDKEIRQELAEARAALRLAWQQGQGNPTGEPTWQAGLARFEQQLQKLNRKIADFNLIVPIVSKQRAHLRLEVELRRLQEEKEA